MSWFETYQYLEVAARGGLSWKRPRFLLCVIVFVCFLSLACLLAPHHVSWLETYQYLEVAARGGLSWKRPRFLLCVIVFVCFLSLACLLAPHHNFAYSRLRARSPLSVVWFLCVFPSLPFFSSSSVVARSLGQCDVTRGHVCGFVRG